MLKFETLDELYNELEDLLSRKNNNIDIDDEPAQYHYVEGMHDGLRLIKLRLGALIAEGKGEVCQ